MDTINKHRIKEIQQLLQKNDTEKCRLLCELFSLCGMEVEVEGTRAIDKARTRSALQALLHKP